MTEKKEIKRDGAKAQKNSGRGKIAKADATWHNFVVDYKDSGNTFGISRAVWTKICSDAFRVNTNAWPVLKLILGGTESNSAHRTRLAVIEWALLEELISVYEEKVD